MTKLKMALDPGLQSEIVALAFQQREFTVKFQELVHENKELKKNKIRIFSNPNLDTLADVFFSAFDENDGIVPSDGIVCSKILELNRNDADKAQLRDMFLKLKSKNVQMSPLHEKKLIEIIKVAEITSFVNDSIEIMRNVGGTADFLKLEESILKMGDKLSRLSFKEETKVNMNNFFDIIKEFASETSSNIQVGLEKICGELNGGGEQGGLARQEVTVLLAGTNDGKSIGALSLACNALRSGHRIGVYSLEGRKLQAPLRIISNLTNIKYTRLIRFRDYINKSEYGKLKGYFNDGEIQAIKNAQETYENKITVVHGIARSEIEHIIACIEKEYKLNPFDLMIIDYGQLIESTKSFKKDHERLMYVFRELEKLASKLKIAILVPMQVNRAGLEAIARDLAEGEEFPTYKMSHVAGAYGALKTAGCIININRTVDERKQAKLRWSIAKQREGIVGVQWGIVGNFETMNITEGEEYMYENPAMFHEEPTKGSIMDTFSAGKEPKIKLQKLLSQNELLRELGQREFDTNMEELLKDLKTIFSKKESISDLETLKRDINLGNAVVDDPEEEMNTIEGDIIEAKHQVEEMQETQLFQERMGMLLKGEDIRTYKNILEIISGRIDEVKEELPDLAKFAQLLHLTDKVLD